MRRIAAVVVIVCFGSGCALSIGGPRTGAPVSEAPKCDRGRGTVVADGLFGASAGVLGLARLGEGDDGTGFALIGLGAVLIASAWRGNRAASACERARAEHTAYVASTVATRMATTSKPKAASAPKAASPPKTAIAPAVPTPVQAAQTIEETRPEAPVEDDEWSAFWEEAP